MTMLQHAAARWRRVAGMPPREMMDRGLEAGRRVADRCTVAAGAARWDRTGLSRRLAREAPAIARVARALDARTWNDAHRALADHFVERAPRFVVHPSWRRPLADAVLHAHPEAADDANRHLDRLLGGAYDLLGYESLQCAGHDGRVDWHRDPVSGRSAPRTCWVSVPYLDPASGDHKVVWELNRHQHWLALGRAWWLTGRDAAPQMFIAQLEDWLAEDPPLVGINWASSLELALRSLSWTWAIELFAEAPSSTPWLVDLVLGLDRQLTQIERFLSRYFSPNTHLLGEALALYVCGRVFPELAASDARAAVGRDILLAELRNQVLPDGGHAERSPHYHRYALEFLLLTLAVARATEDDGVAAAVEPVTSRMAGFLHHISGPDGRFPLIGDDDGGELCPIDGYHHGHARATLGWAAALLARPDLRIDPVPESVTWLTANTRTLASGRIAVKGHAPEAASQTFKETGYVSLRHGGSRVLFDVGPHGFLNGGHAHADALSVVITVRGMPLLIDPGTGTYTMSPDVRDRMRSSVLHNTMSVDGRSQADVAGPFHWRTKADSTLQTAALNPRFDYAEGVTAAWAPDVHERSVLALADDRWVVFDRLEPAGRAMALHWHLHPEWTAEVHGDSVAVRHPSGLAARIDVPGARIECFRGDDRTGLGWFAPVYGRIIPTTTLRAIPVRTPSGWMATVVALDTQGPGGATTWLDSECIGGEPRSVGIATMSGGHVDVFVRRAANAPDVVSARIGAGNAHTVTSDARLLHVRLRSEGNVEDVHAVDVGQLRIAAATDVVLQPAPRVADVTVQLSGTRADIVTSTPRPDVRVVVQGPTGYRADEPQQQRLAEAPIAGTRI